MQLKDLIHELVEISRQAGDRMDVKTALGSRDIEHVLLTKDDDGILIVNLD